MQLPFSKIRKVKYSQKKNTQCITIDSKTAGYTTKTYYQKRVNNKFKKIDAFIEKVGITQTLFATLIAIVAISSYIASKIN